MTERKSFPTFPPHFSPQFAPQRSPSFKKKIPYLEFTYMQHTRYGIFWLGRSDSNTRMTESEANRTFLKSSNLLYFKEFLRKNGHFLESSPQITPQTSNSQSLHSKFIFHNLNLLIKLFYYSSFYTKLIYFLLYFHQAHIFSLQFELLLKLFAFAPEKQIDNAA